MLGLPALLLCAFGSSLFICLSVSVRVAENRAARQRRWQEVRKLAGSKDFYIFLFFSKSSSGMPDFRGNADFRVFY